MEVTENGFVFSDDNKLLNVAAIHDYLTNHSYWAKGIPYQTVERSLSNSLCFGIYKDGQQVGFARWITDRATFGYLADVYVLETCRGLGLSKKLLELMLAHPELQGLRRYMLATLDAHGLYAQFGFKPIPHPERLMGIAVEDIYTRKR